MLESSIAAPPFGATAQAYQDQCAPCRPQPMHVSSFEDVLREHAVTLAGVTRRFCRNESEREDLMQEVRVAVWRALPRFRGESSLKTYIYRVAHNRASTLARRRPKPTTPMDENGALNLVERRGYARVDGTSMMNARHEGGHEDELSRAQRRHKVAVAICDLPPSLRGVLRLELRDLSDAEIAHHCGITEKNVSVRLTRARQQLRRRLVTH